MIKHIVFWTLKEENKANDLKELKDRLLQLPSQIKEIVELEVGVNYNQDATAFDVSLYSTFRSKADLDAYQVHPAHQKVVSYMKTIVKNRAVVDYEI